MPSRRTRQLGRRRFLQALGVSTVTTGVVSAKIPGGPTFDTRREVPRVHALRHKNHDEFTTPGVRPEREPVINTISREKWRLVEAAARARKRVERQLSDLDPTPDVMVEIPDGEDASGPRGIVVRKVTEVTEEGGSQTVVSSSDYTIEDLTETVKTRFPDRLSATPDTSTHPASPLAEVPRPNNASEVEGMPIRTEHVTVEKSGHNGGADHYDRKYRPVPAGCAMEPLGGTLGTPAKDISGNELFVTAGHLLQGESTAYQNEWNDDKLGEIKSNNVEVGNAYDAGLITNLSLNPTWQIADQNSDSYRLPIIRGSRTKEWLKDGQGEGVQLKKQGVTNPLETGTIDKWEDTKFESTHREEDGDSGGPYWHTVNVDEAYICGIHEQKAESSNWDAYSQATLMSAIESLFWIYV